MLDAYCPGFFRKLSNGAKSWYYLCSFHQNYVQPSCSHATEFQFSLLNICLLLFPALDKQCILENFSRALSLTWKSLFWMASWSNVKDPEFNKWPHLLLFFPLISKHFSQSPLFRIYGMAKLMQGLTFVKSKLENNNNWAGGSWVFSWLLPIASLGCRPEDFMLPFDLHTCPLRIMTLMQLTLSSPSHSGLPLQAPTLGSHSGLKANKTKHSLPLGVQRVSDTLEEDGDGIPVFTIVPSCLLL